MYNTGYMVYLIRMSHSRCGGFITDCAKRSKLAADYKAKYYCFKEKNNEGFRNLIRELDKLTHLYYPYIQFDRFILFQLFK